MKKFFTMVIGMGLLSGMLLAADSLDDANKAYNEGNYTKAIELYKTLCDKKEAKACSSLGYIYRNAKGVSENTTLAQQYYKKACDAGDKESCSNANW
ncbi:sel1 repeat family protein [Helicobacter aurati]|uniref:Beta-lactamase n=1 Tax=Helicobacter aurati TaxID=137778 RepID=A0A3D8J4H6_9HELI|nr:sel1 repeat family protein [Helicobacter aurati]RDU72407.1 sel1 repeat family protein [Helicobacter aurati]